MADQARVSRRDAAMMRDTHTQDIRPSQAEIVVAADRDPLDGLDPGARALVLDILGIFLADAHAATSDVALDEPTRRSPPAAPTRRCRGSRTAARPR